MLKERLPWIAPEILVSCQLVAGSVASVNPLTVSRLPHIGVCVLGELSTMNGYLVGIIKHVSCHRRNDRVDGKRRTKVNRSETDR